MPATRVSRQRSCSTLLRSFVLRFSTPDSRICDATSMRLSKDSLKAKAVVSDVRSTLSHVSYLTHLPPPLPVHDLIKPPDLNQARVNKCLIALVNRKIVLKDNTSVRSLRINAAADLFCSCLALCPPGLSSISLARGTELRI